MLDCRKGKWAIAKSGHLNIGAGRVVHMDVTRIDQMISSGEFFQHPVLLDSMRHGRAHRLHIMGLCSDGGVHSLLTHLYALLKLAKQEHVEQVFVHCFMDGRDTGPQSGAGYLEQIQKQMREIGVGKIASVSGRYYAMDRDKRWDRIERAFGAMVLGNGVKSTDPIEAVKKSYEHGITDEFIEPITIVDERNEPVGLIRDDDACIFFNYRADRGREMTLALTDATHSNPIALAGAEESAFHHDDAVRQDHQGALRAAARASQQHTGRRYGPLELEKPAGRRDRKIRARDLFLQRWKREAIRGREPGNGSVAEGRDL